MKSATTSVMRNFILLLFRMSNMYVWNFDTYHYQNIQFISKKRIITIFFLEIERKLPPTSRGNIFHLLIRLVWIQMIPWNILKTPFQKNKCWGRNYSYNRHTTHRNTQQLYFWNLGHLNHIHFGKCTFCKLCCILYSYVRVFETDWNCW